MPTPFDALLYARRFIGNMPIDDPEIRLAILDDANKELWMPHPWPWSVATLESVTTVNDQQDYNLVTSYPNFLCLQQATIADGQQKTDLVVSSTLAQTSVMKGQPKQLMFLPGSPQKLRVLPVPTGYSTPPTVLAIYKKKATEINDTNVEQDFTTTTGVLAEWFWVYQAIVLRKAYEFVRDQRAGSVTVGPNGVQYTGQYAVVEAAIADMWKVEEKFWTAIGQEVTPHA